MSKTYVLPVEIEPLDDGTGYLATCDAIQGCLAEGSSVAEAMENLEDVARTLLELRVRDGLGIPADLQEAPATAVRLRAQILVSAG
jgi:predicted RNase H-like HicB family nuclease